MNDLQAPSQLNSIKEGDIIAIGKHILGCGKAEDGSFLEKLLQQQKINLILTDQPYACDYVEGKQAFSQLPHQTSIVNDHLQSEGEYFLQNVFCSYNNTVINIGDPTI
jgi:hypothetical protein